MTLQGLFLSQTDPRPMYLQIAEQIRLKVLAGDWSAGHSLPSIRELAANTGVSVITIKRAYMELEHEGVIVTHQGRGSFVSSHEELKTELNYSELYQHINAAVTVAARLNMEKSELLKKVESACEEQNI